MAAPAERSGANRAALAANEVAGNRKRAWNDAVRSDQESEKYGHGGDRGSYMTYKMEKLREQNAAYANALPDRCRVRNSAQRDEMGSSHARMPSPGASFLIANLCASETRREKIFLGKVFFVDGYTDPPIGVREA